MRWLARVRLVMARRPWMRWALVSTAALVVVVTVAQRLGDLEQRRSAWGQVRSVLVARHDLAPGTPVTVDDVVVDERPAAVVPQRALTSVDALSVTARTWQWVSEGEVLVSYDLETGTSLASRLPVGTRGVVVTAHELPTRSGDAVEVVVDGDVVTEAVVIEVLDGDRGLNRAASTPSLLIAVPERRAAQVATAAAEGRAMVMLTSSRRDQRQPASITVPMTPANTTR